MEPSDPNRLISSDLRLHILAWHGGCIRVGVNQQTYENIRIYLRSPDPF
jgi:hypothetical protein